MKEQKRGATVTAPPNVVFPIMQIGTAEMVERMGDGELTKLLGDRAADAWGRYLDDWHDHTGKLRGPDSYKLKAAERCFRGEQYHHPMDRNQWAEGGRENVVPGIRAQLDRALKAGDWQEVMVLGGMLCVREMLYGRPVITAPAPKAKAVQKTAKKKPATKKPARRKSTGYSWSPSPPRPAPAKKTAPSNVATLKDLVAQAKPLFAKNPKLDRQGLINKIGRRYERLTTFDELRTLCAGKTVTTHSVKKPTVSAADIASGIGDHTCHWPGCERQVPPAMWGCRAHWYALPKELRDRIWRTYKPGQETTMTPSTAYLEAARDVQAWIAAHSKAAAPAPQGNLL